MHGKSLCRSLPTFRAFFHVALYPLLPVFPFARVPTEHWGRIPALPSLLLGPAINPAGNSAKGEVHPMGPGTVNGACVCTRTRLVPILNFNCVFWRLYYTSSLSTSPS